METLHERIKKEAEITWDCFNKNRRIEHYLDTQVVCTQEEYDSLLLDFNSKKELIQLDTHIFRHLGTSVHLIIK